MRGLQPPSPPPLLSPMVCTVCVQMHVVCVMHMYTLVRSPYTDATVKCILHMYIEVLQCFTLYN